MSVESAAPTRKVFRPVTGNRHARMLNIYLVFVAVHFMEHLLEMLQVFVLKIPSTKPGGLLGLAFPALANAEWVHFSYNLFQLAGLLLLAAGFGGTARKWWTIATLFQVWHFFEHTLLQGQALFSQNLFGQPVPTSLVQALGVPRPHLHFIYNLAVVLCQR